MEENSSRFVNNGREFRCQRQVSASDIKIMAHEVAGYRKAIDYLSKHTPKIQFHKRQGNDLRRGRGEEKKPKTITYPGENSFPQMPRRRSPR